MLLWLVFAGLTAAALAAVLWPLLRGERSASPRAAHDAALYAHQLEEIDADLERGLIAPAEAQAARTEISRRLLRAADRDQAEPARKLKPAAERRTAAIILVCTFLLLPVLSLGLYLTRGSPSLPDQPLAARLEAPADSEGITGLIARVEARLRQHPEDGEGWDVIAPVYLRLQRYNDAADAYERALRLLGENTQRLVGHGEALVAANNGVVTEEARQAFEKALSRDASLLKARFWLAVAKEQDGQFAEAASAWRNMLSGAPADAPWRPVVEERLRFAETHAGAQGAPGGQASAQPDSAPAARGPTQEDIASAQSMTPEQRQAMIKQMVEGLAQRLAEKGDDLEGWQRLVRAYTVLGQRDNAVRALGDARRNFEGNTQALAQLDALATSLGL